MMVLNLPIFANRFELRNNAKLTQYTTNANNKIPNTMFDEKF